MEVVESDQLRLGFSGWFGVSALLVGPVAVWCRLAYGNLARLQILVEELALQFSRETFKWPELDTRIDAVPSKRRPKR